MKRAFAGACWYALLVLGASVYDPVRHIESARLYGNIDAYAYYFVDLLVGTPPQRASVILDTGSGLTAFPCAGCPHCGKHIDPNFDVSKSSSAKWTPCGGATCRGSCSGGHCTYRQSYQEGSSISGFWFQDYVRFGDAFQNNPPVMASLGCHQNENKLFFTQKANGIFGIQGSRTLLQLLFDDHEHVESKVFSICLAEWGGAMTVGGHNASYHRTSVQYVRLLGSRYGVTLTEMKVDGQVVNGFRNTVIDSGTTYTYMGSAAYKKLRSSIEESCARKGNCGRRSNTCWKVPTLYEGLKNFPNVEVVIESTISIWEPRAYLYRKGNTDTFCYGFENDGPNAPTVLGASWMLYKEVIFDLRQNMVGIAAAECPSYKERPPHDPHAVLGKLPPPPAPIAPASTTAVSSHDVAHASQQVATRAPASIQQTSATLRLSTTAAAIGPSSEAHSVMATTPVPKLSTTSPPKLGSAANSNFLPVGLRGDVGVGTLAFGSVGVVLGAFSVVCCITRCVSRKSIDAYKPVHVPTTNHPNGGVPSDVVGNTFEIGDDADEYDFALPKPLE